MKNKILSTLVVICILLSLSTTCFAESTTVDSRLVDWNDYNSALGWWEHVGQQYYQADIPWVSGGYTSTHETYETIKSDYWWGIRRKTQVVYTYSNPSYGALPKTNETMYHSWGSVSGF